MNYKLKPEYKKYVRIGISVILLILGAVFMLLPFIPLGYLFIIAGIFLLVPYVSFFKRWLDYFKKKDKKNRVERVEDKVNQTEDSIDNRIVRDKEE
ncbi:MAG: hypothetical protein ACOC2F_09025 [Bacteroidota bacterium]